MTSLRAVVIALALAVGAHAAAPSATVNFKVIRRQQSLGAWPLRRRPRSALLPPPPLPFAGASNTTSHVRPAHHPLPLQHGAIGSGISADSLKGDVTIESAVSDDLTVGLE